MPIVCSQLSKRFADLPVIDALDWTLEDGSVWGVLGPSGAGKTTLLRLLAGLEHADRGQVHFQSAPGQPLPPPRIGMVFQGLGLWPHLTAFEHLEYVLPGLNRLERSAKCREMLDAVQLAERLWPQRPGQLSGGESQRLALARALAIEPQLLLLDEPLAQVDVALRDDLIELFREQLSRRRMTAVFVSHSWQEVTRLATRLAVLVNGRLRQQGSGDELLRHPADAQVARLTGPVLRLPQSLLESGRIECTMPVDQLVLENNSYLVRPQQLQPAAVSDRSRWRIVSCHLHGAGWLALAECGGQRLSVPIREPLLESSETGLRLVPL